MTGSLGGHKVGSQKQIYSAEQIQGQNLLDITPRRTLLVKITTTATFTCTGPQTVAQKGAAPHGYSAEEIQG
jgi:hypothetical protein